MYPCDRICVFSCYLWCYDRHFYWAWLTCWLLIKMSAIFFINGNMLWKLVGGSLQLFSRDLSGNFENHKQSSVKNLHRESQLLYILWIVAVICLSISTAYLFKFETPSPYLIFFCSSLVTCFVTWFAYCKHQQLIQGFPLFLNLLSKYVSHLEHFFSLFSFNFSSLFWFIHQLPLLWRFGVQI